MKPLGNYTAPRKSHIPYRACIIMGASQLIVLAFYLLRAFIIKEDNDMLSAWEPLYMLPNFIMLVLFGTLAVLSRFLYSEFKLRVLGILSLLILGIVPLELTNFLYGSISMAYLQYSCD